MSAIQKIKAWSFSLWKTYQQCPRKVKLNKIDGIKEPGSAAMDRGTDIHADAERYVKEPTSPMAESLKLYRKEFLKLRELGDIVKPEEEWAFNQKWEPVPWKVGWVRLKMDCYYITTVKGKRVMTIIDYKTGKVYEDNKKQLSFYALAGFLRFPDVDSINVELWYLDQGPKHTHKDSYVAKELEDMKAAWVAASTPLLNDTIFAPRPGWYCRFCFYSAAKNGNCEYQ